MPAFARWLVLPSGRRLHRVAYLARPEDLLEGETVGGTVMCGLVGPLQVPGAFSRMGLPRCARCCRAVGIPQGKGAPFNYGIQEPR
jgi:hypothetical protein